MSLEVIVPIVASIATVIGAMLKYGSMKKKLTNDFYNNLSKDNEAFRKTILTQYNILKESYDQLDTKYNNLSTKVEKLNEENHTLKDQLEDYKKENKLLRDSVTTLEKEKVKMEMTIEDLRKELDLSKKAM